MALEIFKLKGSIFVDNSKANNSIAQTTKKGGSMAKSLAGGTKAAAAMAAKVAVAGAAAGAAAAGGIYKLAKSAADTADNVDKMSQKIGISTETYQELNFVCSQSGASVDNLKAGMKKLTNVIKVTHDETSKEKTALEELGVAAVDSKGNMRGQEEVMWDCFKALQKLDNQSEKAALASKLFGKAGSELMPMLNGASGSIEEMRQKAHDLGLVLGEDSIKQGVKFTDTLDQVKRSGSAIVTRIGLKVMPMVQKLLDYIIKNMPKIKKTANMVFKAVAQFWEMYVKPKIELAKKMIKAFMKEIKKNIPELKQNFIDIAKALLPVAKAMAKVFGRLAVKYVKVAVNAFVLMTRVTARLARAFSKHMPKIKKSTNGAFSGIVKFWKQHLKPTFEAIKDFIENKLWPVIKFVFLHVIKPTLKAIGHLFKNLWTKTIKPVFTAIIDYIGAVFKGDFKGALKAVLKGAKAVWSGIVEVFKLPLNSVIEVINSFMGVIIDAINGVLDKANELVNKIPKKIRKTIGITAIPHLDKNLQLSQLAKGGEFASDGSAIVGEAGAEMVTLPKGARVTPLNSNNNAFASFEAKQDDLINLVKELIDVMPKQVVLSTGQTVGALTPYLDKSLGQTITKKKRGS